MKWRKTTEEIPFEYESVRLLVDNGDEHDYTIGYYDIWLESFIEEETDRILTNVTAWQKIK